MMRKALLIFMIMVFLCNGDRLFSQDTVKTYQLNDDLVIQEIEKNLFVVTHSFPFAANCLLVRYSSNIFLLVDTPWNNDATQLLFEWIKKTYGEFKLVAVNTHFHRDNLGGNDYLISQDVPVYGSDLTIQLLGEKGRARTNALYESLQKPEYEQYLEALKASKIKAPDRIFKLDHGLELRISEGIVDIFFPGTGHSPDNVVVYFRERKVLFGGCMVKSMNSKTLGYAGDADLNEWPKSLQNIKKKFKEIRLVIPGHGKWGNMSLLHHTIKLVEAN
jgi:glyoxylase-like metal-dependent hydrolase (beta-lactamase superfamily II)